MNIKSNKGFTMVELLGVIVVLAILMGIGIFSVNQLIAKSKQEQLVHQKETLKAAAMSYAQDNRDKLPVSIGSKEVIRASTLKDNNYLKNDIYNAKKESCMANSYVRVYKSSNNKYEYTPFLCCGSDVCEEPDDSLVAKPQITVFFSDSSGNQDVSDLSNKVREVYIKMDIKGSADETAKIEGYSFSLSAKIAGKESEVFSSGTLSANESKHIEIFKPISEYVDITGMTDFKIEVTAINNLGGTNTATANQNIQDTLIPTCSPDIDVRPKIETKQWINKSDTVTRKVTVTCNDASGSGCIRDTFSRSWPNKYQKNAEYAYIQVKDNSGHKNIPDNYLTADLCTLPSIADTCRVQVNVDTVAPTIAVTSTAFDGTKQATDTANLTIKEDAYKNLVSGWANAAKYPSGISYTITASDNIHLDKWTWTTGNNADASSGTFSDSNINQNNNNCGMRTAPAFTIKLSAEGKRTGTLTVYDIAGNKTVVTIKANIDRTPPSIKNSSWVAVRPYVNNSGTAVSGTYSASNFTNKHIAFIVNKNNIVDALSGYKHTTFQLLNPSNSNLGTSNQTDRYNVSSSGRNGVFTVKYKLCDKADNCQANFSEASKIKFDTAAPKCNLKVTGKAAGNGWYGGSVKVTIDSKTDNVVSGVTGSGIPSNGFGLIASKTVTYNKKSSLTLKTAKGTVVYCYVKDAVGNASSSHTAAIKIDTSPPSCTLKIVGTKGTNDWYKAKNATVKFATKKDKESGISKYYLSKDKAYNFPSKNSNEVTQGNTKSYVTWWGHVMDKAGKKNRCSIKLRVDKDPPKCSGSPWGSNRSGCGAQYNQYASDAISGLNSSNTDSRHCYIYEPLWYYADWSWGRVCHGGTLTGSHWVRSNYTSGNSKVYHGLNAKSAQLKVQFCPGDAAGNQVCCAAGKITIDYYGTLCG